VRSSDRMLTYLTAKLFTLSPKPKETMETFLNRCALRRASMPRMTLSSRTLTLISDALSNLSRPWLLATDRMWTGRVAHGLEVSRLLETEDNARKQLEQGT